jgi:hypothetical protein
VQPQILVVSNPPHGDIDIASVADVLGLGLEDATLKLAYSAPEVLSASGPERAAEIANDLTAAGMRVVVIDGHRMADVPWPRPASSFSFSDTALVVHVGGDTVQVGYGEPVLAIICRPPAELADRAGRPSGSAHVGQATAEAIEWSAILDLYVSRQDGLERVTIVAGLTDFSALGAAAGLTGAHSVGAAAAECVRRFRALKLDSRLVDVRPRQRFVMGDASFDPDLRKLYSYGTLLLRQILDSISPELRDLTQFEFGSRIAYAVNEAEKTRHS